MVTIWQSTETNLIGLCLEGFFYGIYSAIFVMYLQYERSKEDTDNSKTKRIIFYSQCVLYILCVTLVVFDIAYFMIQTAPTDTNVTLVLYYNYAVSVAVYGCCDFLSQSIIIYRCWALWDWNIYVVIIPSILACAFLPIWLSYIGSLYFNIQEHLANGNMQWGETVVLTGLGISLIVNAFVTALIVLRIAKMYWIVKSTLDGETIGRSKFRSVIFIVIESGMALFAFQMVWIVAIIMQTYAAGETLSLIVGTHQMFICITPTIIQLRISMALSFNQEKCMIEGARGLRLVGIPDSSSEMGKEESKDGSPQSSNFDVIDIGKFGDEHI